MNINKQLSSKCVDGKYQILIRVDVSRSIRPSLKTGVFVRKDLFINGEIVHKQGRRNTVLAEEIDTADRLLQSFCLKVISLCQETAKNAGIPVTKDWLSLQMKTVVTNNVRETLPSCFVESAISTPVTNKRTKIVPVSLSETDSTDQSPKYESQDFYKLISQYCQWKQLSASRVRCYKTLARQLRRFELYQQAMVSTSFVLNYDSIIPEDLEAFRSFVRDEHILIKKHPVLFKQIFAEAPYTCNEKKPKTIGERSENYLSILLKRLAAVFHWLQKTKKTKNDPFEDFNIGQEHYGDPIYLTKEERERLTNYEMSQCPEILQEQRDIFIFQCLTGCRVGDLLSLKRANVQGDILEYVPSKTKDIKGDVKLVRVTLHPTALAILDKYSDLTKGSMLLPFISAPQYNQKIKEVFRYCEITRTVQYLNQRTRQYEARRICDIVTSHMARKTFIGVAYHNTHDPNLIGKMTGHVEGSKAFNRYRKIEDDDLRSVTNML